MRVGKTDEGDYVVLSVNYFGQVRVDAVALIQAEDYHNRLGAEFRNMIWTRWRNDLLDAAGWIECQIEALDHNNRSDEPEDH